MGLLALAAAIVDTLACYVLSKKDQYFDAKYEVVVVDDKKKKEQEKTKEKDNEKEKKDK